MTVEVAARDACFMCGVAPSSLVSRCQHDACDNFVHESCSGGAWICAAHRFQPPTPLPREAAVVAEETSPRPKPAKRLKVAPKITKPRAKVTKPPKPINPPSARSLTAAAAAAAAAAASAAAAAETPMAAASAAASYEAEDAGEEGDDPVDEQDLQVPDAGNTSRTRQGSKDKDDFDDEADIIEEDGDDAASKTPTRGISPVDAEVLERLAKNKRSIQNSIGVLMVDQKQGDDNLGSVRCQSLGGAGRVLRAWGFVNSDIHGRNILLRRKSRKTQRGVLFDRIHYEFV